MKLAPCSEQMVRSQSFRIFLTYSSIENHIPTYLYCAEILSETLDMSPLFLEMYTSRVRARLENDEELAGRLPELMERGDPRVFTLSRLYERRSEQWVPDFDLF